MRSSSRVQHLLCCCYILSKILFYVVLQARFPPVGLNLFPETIEITVLLQKCNI